MSLDIYFFKKGFDVQKSRTDINAAYMKLQAIKEELERLEDEYEAAKGFSLNITHNLHRMAKAVGLSEVLWSPKDIGITIAYQMIPLLEKGIKILEANPDKYKKFNPPNGYGSYEEFVSFCKSVLDNCHKYPEAVIETSA